MGVEKSISISEFVCYGRGAAIQKLSLCYLCYLLPHDVA